MSNDNRTDMAKAIYGDAQIPLSLPFLFPY